MALPRFQIQMSSSMIFKFFNFWLLHARKCLKLTFPDSNVFLFLKYNLIFRILSKGLHKIYSHSTQRRLENDIKSRNSTNSTSTTSLFVSIIGSETTNQNNFTLAVKKGNTLPGMIFDCCLWRLFLAGSSHFVYVNKNVISMY